MFAEDTSAFFDHRDGFAVEASFTPAGGGASTLGAVLFDEAAEVVQGEVVTLAPVAMLPVPWWPSIKADDLVTIAGRSYRVRWVQVLDDGALKRLVLVRV